MLGFLMPSTQNIILNFDKTNQIITKHKLMTCKMIKLHTISSLENPLKTKKNYKAFGLPKSSTMKINKLQPMLFL